MNKKIIILGLIFILVLFVISACKQEVGGKISESEPQPEADACSICITTCDQAKQLCIEGCERNPTCIDNCDQARISCIRGCKCVGIEEEE